MAVEIERKFLVTGDGWRARAAPGVAYRQGYLSTSPRCSVRVRVGGDRAWLNVKAATVGVARSEFEYAIPVADAEQMLAQLCLGSVVEKTRYLVEHGGRQWEVDVFAGANAGLVVAEVELESEDATVEPPPWVGADVSHDVRYYNQRLAEHPYSRW